MSKAHALLIAAAIGIAAVLGLVAATRTARVGARTSPAGTVSDARIAARASALDRMEIALRKQLRQRPPALPALPTARAHPQRVRYVRPAPIVTVVHRSAEHEDGESHEARGGEGEGGFDD